jgi:hypothetical protein
MGGRAGLVIALALAGGCTGLRSLPDGKRAPGGMATLVGSFEFRGFGIEPLMVLVDTGGRALTLQPKQQVFCIAVPPGEYEIDYIDKYRLRGDPVRIVATAERVTYIGAWCAVVGLAIELRDGLDEVRPGLERRYGPMEIEPGIPGGPRRIEIDWDPLLDSAYQFSNRY